MCTEPGKTAEGVQAVKRLMLDHADTLYMELRSGSGNRLQLEIGYSKKEGDEVTVCKVRGNPIKLTVRVPGREDRNQKRESNHQHFGCRV